MYLTENRFNAGDGRPDTIEIYDAASEQADVIGRFLFTPTGREAGYVLETGTTGVIDNSVEYEYEDRGLPIDSVGTDGWVRVIHAFTRDSTLRKGWVSVSEPGTDSLLWADYLPDRNLYFENPIHLSFYDRKGGSVEDVRLEEGDCQRYDYIMHPIEADGPWMKVEVVSPGDYCADPESPVRAERWIRYLSEEGRPRVWYYTRGC